MEQKFLGKIWALKKSFIEYYLDLPCFSGNSKSNNISNLLQSLFLPTFQSSKAVETKLRVLVSQIIF